MPSEIVLKLTPQALAVINEGLLLVPFGRAAPGVNEINRQLREAEKAGEATE